MYIEDNIMGNNSSIYNTYTNITTNKCGSVTTTYSTSELKDFQNQRYNMFKATITVCIIYAILSAILLLLGYYTSFGEILFNKLLPFMIVFILGCIIVIIYFCNKIYNLKPVNLVSNVNYDVDSCPDYWTMVYQPNIDSSSVDRKINASLFSYKCVLNSNIIDKKNFISSINENNLGKIASNYDPTTRGPEHKWGLTDVHQDLLDNSQYVNTIPFNSNIVHIYANLNNDNIIRASGLKDSEKEEFKKHAMYMNFYANSNDSNLTEFTPINKYPKTELPSYKRYLLYNSNIPILYKKDTATSTFGDITTSGDQLNFLDKIDTKSNVVPLVCDQVYPYYLANIDGNHDNKFRCAYSKICGAPWSDLNCINN